VCDANSCPNGACDVNGVCQYKFAGDYAGLHMLSGGGAGPGLHGWDWSTDPKVVTGVKNQGQPESDWAFSATGALEGQVGQLADFTGWAETGGLSEQELVDCSAQSLTNGSPASGLQYFIQYGAETEAEYPYVAAVDACSYDASSVVAYMAGIYRCPIGDENSLADILVADGPISVVLNGNWFSGYTGGIANPDCNAGPPVYYAALLVGFGEDQNGNPYWKVKTSFGTSWGMSGYFEIVRGQNACGIANYAIFPVAVRS